MNWTKNKSLYLVLGCAFSVLLVLLDQLTKISAVKNLSDGKTVWLIKDVLCFHYLENTGAAFSILEGKMNFFFIITPIVCIFIAYMYYKMYALEKFGPLQIICILVISGAIGNYIDRVTNNYVIDFIYFSLIDFPIFNVADIYVTCAVIALIILIIAYYKEEDLNRLKLFNKKNKEE